MKQTTFLIIITAMISHLIISQAKAAELIVKVDSVKHDKGMIYAQIFKGAENYKNGKALSGTMAKAKTGTMKLTFGNLEAGKYAVRIYHDENDNKKLDTNLFGIPTEAFAFSNQAMANFGPPSYSDMEITITKDDEQITTIAKMQ